MTQKRMLSKEKFFLPKYLIEGYDGDVLRFRISKEEAKVNSSPTAKNGLPSNPTKGSQKSATNSGSGGGSSTQNKTASSGNMTNATAVTSKPPSKTNSMTK